MKIKGSHAAQVNVTPRFAVPTRWTGRKMRFGVGEIIRLSFGAGAAPAGTWVIRSGALPARLNSAGLAPGTADFTCPDVPQRKTSIEIKLQYKSAPGARDYLVQIKFNVIAPRTGKVIVLHEIHKTPAPGSGQPNKPNAGYFGRHVIGPSDVSFKGIQIKEGGGMNSATGVLRDFHGNIHTVGDWIDPDVGAAARIDGTVIGWDEVFTPANNSPPGGWRLGSKRLVGSSVTPIPWYYRVIGDPPPGRLFVYVKHKAWCLRDGSMSVNKGGRTVTKALNAPLQYTHPLVAALTTARRYLQ